MTWQRVLSFWLFLFLALPAAAQDFPKLTGRVVDQANLLDPAREAALASRLEALEQQTGRQLVVATLSSLQGRTIEDYGYRLGRQWGIGSAEKDDGVLLIVAPNERRVRVETGYGARVFLTDAVSSVIIRNAILPRFRDNDFAGGIEAGVSELVTQMQLPPAEAQRRVQEAEAAAAAPRQQRGGGGIGLLPLLFWGLVILFVFSSFARRAGGRRYRGKRRRGHGGVDPFVLLWGLNALGNAGRGGWSGGGGLGGGGGGGFGGFSGGGGSFGGGGASGSW